MYTVDDLYKEHGESLGLELIAGNQGMDRKILVPEAHRPGLALAGMLKNHAYKRLLVFGKVEIAYLRTLSTELRISRLEALFTHDKIPAVIVARHYRPLKELKLLCEMHRVPLFRVKDITMRVLSKLTILLGDAFAPSVSCHGCLVEVFGVGVLIQGESSIGKSEAALGLIERGHRLVSDDIVKVRQRENNFLEGYGVALTRHHMEIRGIGIINVANLYGIVCVREKMNLDIVVKLEVWDDSHFYDRVGLEDRTTEILGIKLPFHLLPVKPGRDVVLLIETIALNHRLKKMGYHSAKEFSNKLLSSIEAKSNRKVL